MTLTSTIILLRTHSQRPSISLFCKLRWLSKFISPILTMCGPQDSGTLITLLKSIKKNTSSLTSTLKNEQTENHTRSKLGFVRLEKTMNSISKEGGCSLTGRLTLPEIFPKTLKFKMSCCSRKYQETKIISFMLCFDAKLAIPCFPTITLWKWIDLPRAYLLCLCGLCFVRDTVLRRSLTATAALKVPMLTSLEESQNQSLRSWNLKVKMKSTSW